MIWQWFLIITAFVYLIRRIQNLKTVAKHLRLSLTFCYSDQERRNKAHILELEAERALTKAAIDKLAYPSALDISECEAEMDRLEAEDLIEEIDEDFINGI